MTKPISRYIVGACRAKAREMAHPDDIFPVNTKPMTGKRANYFALGVFDGVATAAGGVDELTDAQWARIKREIVRAYNEELARQ